MFQLYGALGAASLAPQCVLEEAGLPYELVEVDISENSERDPEYLKLNPQVQNPLDHRGVLDNRKVKGAQQCFKVS
jgi:glutathione S-transferase